MNTITCTAKYSLLGSALPRESGLRTHRTTILVGAALPRKEQPKKQRRRHRRGKVCTLDPPKWRPAGQAANVHSDLEKECDRNGVDATSHSLPAGLVAYRSEKTDWHSEKQNHRRDRRRKTKPRRPRDGQRKTGRGRNYNYLNGKRIGEASNPGPKAEDIFAPCERPSDSCLEGHWHKRNKPKRPKSKNESGGDKPAMHPAARRILQRKEVVKCDKPGTCGKDHFHPATQAMGSTDLQTGYGRDFDAGCDGMNHRYEHVHGWTPHAAAMLRGSPENGNHPAPRSPEERERFEAIIRVANANLGNYQAEFPPLQEMAHPNGQAPGHPGPPVVRPDVAQDLVDAAEPPPCAEAEPQPPVEEAAEPPPLQAPEQPVPIPPLVPPVDEEPEEAPEPDHPVVVFEPPVVPPGPLAVVVHDNYVQVAEEQAPVHPDMVREQVTLYINGKETTLTFFEAIGSFFAKMFPGKKRSEYLAARSNASPIIFETFDHKKITRKWCSSYRDKNVFMTRNHAEWKNHANKFVTVGGYDQVAEVEIFTSLYALLAADNALFRRTLTDADGKMLQSYTQACYKVVSDGDKVKFDMWNRHPMIVCNTILHYAQQQILARGFVKLVGDIGSVAGFQ